MRNKSPRVRISRNDNSRIRFEKIMILEVSDIEYIISTFQVKKMYTYYLGISAFHSSNFISINLPLGMNKMDN